MENFLDFSWPVEELIKVGEHVIYRPEQSALGLELVRALDGSQIVGDAEHGGERAQQRQRLH